MVLYENKLFAIACNALLLHSYKYDKLSKRFSLQSCIYHPPFIFLAFNFQNFHCRNSSRHKVSVLTDSFSTQKSLLALCHLSVELENIWQDRITVWAKLAHFTYDIRLGSITHARSLVESDFVSAPSKSVERKFSLCRWIEARGKYRSTISLFLSLVFSAQTNIKSLLLVTRKTRKREYIPEKKNRWNSFVHSQLNSDLITSYKFSRLFIAIDGKRISKE